MMERRYKSSLPHLVGEGISFSKIKMSSVATTLLIYISAVFLVLVCGTLYRELDSNNSIFELCFALSSVLLIGVIGKDVVISNSFIARNTIWLVLLVISFVSIGLLTRSIGSVMNMLRFALLGIAPLFVHILRKTEIFCLYLKAFTNIMVLLGVLSVALWVAGPVLNIIDSNCVIPNDWNGSKTLVLSPGYFGLLYETQSISIGDLNFTRNTGIFVEAPAYALPLFLALAFELLYQERARKWVVGVLLVVAVTSTSTIGIAFSLVTVFFAHHLKTRRKKGTSFLECNAFSFFALFTVLVVGIYLISSRLQTGSGFDRVDDYYAGFRGWLDSPIWGFGFGDTPDEVIKMYFDQSRLNNTGTANSIVQVLLAGGIILSAIYIIAFAAFSVCQTPQERFFGILLVCFFCVSGVWGSWVFILSISFGLERLFSYGLERRNSRNWGLEYLHGISNYH